MLDQTAKPFTPTQEKIVDAVMKPMSRINTWIYRLSGGKVGGRWLRGAPVLLLTATGRKSGKPRVAPLLYLRDGEKVVVVASKGGMSKHPLWYWNLEANPDVEVEIGRERNKMLARRASDPEKAALWPRLIEMYRDFDDYQARTERNIPVIILSPR
ncbi:MAG: nitroreductase family deazaflavin-dependent oxidoreductase [Deltaproteobacteria bacterium]|nr:nitroreductase family deazaflavin-dependent oxidoreductase [Deltaproteobacteria bacterium]